MFNCSSLIKEHGCRLWFNNFLGYSLLFWFISLIGTSTTLPSNCGDVLSAFQSSISSPLSLVKFLVFAGLFLIIPAFLQAAGTSLALEAVANNRSSIDAYFTQGISNLGKFYELTLLSIVCYLPAIFVSTHASFEFSTFSFSGDNLLSLLAIALYAVTGLSLIHAPYILLSKNTKPCEAISQSFRLFSDQSGRVFGSFFYSTLVYGIVIGSAYYFSPHIFDTLHPVRFVLAPLALSLSLFIVAYRYHNHLTCRASSCSASNSTSTCSNNTTKE